MLNSKTNKPQISQDISKDLPIDLAIGERRGILFIGEL